MAGDTISRHGVRTCYSAVRPVHVTAVFPEFAPLARPAMRLHPRPGSPSVEDNSVGGHHNREHGVRDVTFGEDALLPADREDDEALLTTRELWGRHGFGR